MIEICKKIEEIRNEKNMTQKRMGELLGNMSQQSYSQYIQGSDMTIGMVERIAKIYNMSIVDILTYPEKYVPEGSSTPDCEECKKKDEIIENLNAYIRMLKSPTKKK